MADYETMLATFTSELDQAEQFKRDFIRKLAKQLDKEKEKYNIERHQINDKLANDLEGRITRSYVGQCLENDYKYKNKINRIAKATLEVTTDGQTVVSKRRENKDKKDEVEKFELRSFSDKLGEELNARAEYAENVVPAVYQELEDKRNESTDLKTKITEMENKLSANKELLEYIEDNLGYPMTFKKEEDGQIVVDAIHQKDSILPKEITIDLRKFEEEIRESFKKGKFVAKLTQKNGQVKTWT